jgi:predicted peptidase
MAIAMRQQRPDAFAGLVLAAAYPLAGTDPESRPVTLTVPEDESFKGVPLLVFVGERDGGITARPARLSASIPTRAG